MIDAFLFNFTCSTVLEMAPFNRIINFHGFYSLNMSEFEVKIQILLFDILHVHVNDFLKDITHTTFNDVLKSLIIHSKQLKTVSMLVQLFIF